MAERLTIEFHQQDWIPGFAAFLPGASDKPQGRAFCVVNIADVLGMVAAGDVSRSELPYLIAESMMHEIVHVLEAWAGVEFSEERVEALIERYREHALAEGDHAQT